MDVSELEILETKYALVFWDLDAGQVVYGLYEEDNETINEFTYISKEESPEYLNELPLERVGFALYEVTHRDEDTIAFSIQIISTFSMTNPEGEELSPQAFVHAFVSNHDSNFGFVREMAMQGMAH